MIHQAVASMDDVLRVFYGGSAADNALVPTLKHPRQKNVSCVKWRPLSASGLAVAAQDCVVLWKVRRDLIGGIASFYGRLGRIGLDGTQSDVTQADVSRFVIDE